MRFDWVGRLAIGLVIMAPLVLLLSCELMLPSISWTDKPPGTCFVIASFLGLEPTIDILGTPPQQITPSWYLLPTNGMLRSVTFTLGVVSAKTLGVVVAGAALVAPLVLAFFNWSKTPGRAWLSLLTIPVVLGGLGWIGAQAYDERLSNAGLALTAIYFAVFWIVFPLLARRAQTGLT